MSIEKYIAARAAYVRVNAQLDEMASLIRAVSSALAQDRSKFSFSNTGQGLPMEAMLSRDSKSLDANQWPSATVIMDALADWHARRSEVQNTWSSLSQDQRDALQSPPFNIGR